jgi:hypothetical protein
MVYRDHVHVENHSLQDTACYKLCICWENTYSETQSTLIKCSESQPTLSKYRELPPTLSNMADLCYSAHLH